MAISYIGVTNCATVVGPQTSESVSVTVSAGSNRALVVCTGYQDFSNNIAVSTVVFNTSESFTKIRSDVFVGSFTYRAEMWYLLNPSVTTANVVVTWASSAGDPRISFSVVELQGVVQSAPVNTHNGTNGNSGTTSIGLTTTVNNTLLIDNAAIHSGGITVGGTQTQIANRSPGSACSLGVSRFALASAGSKDMQWDNGGVTDFATQAAAFIPAPTGQTLAVDIGSYLLTGIASIFRVGSPLFLRYRK